LPGLFLDRYADAAVIQTTSVAMNALRSTVGAVVRDRLGVRAVFARDDGSARDFEALPRWKGLVAGEGPSTVVYRLGENELEDRPARRQQDGRLPRSGRQPRLVASLAPRGARCLDAFTYHGGFALALARRGGAVLATDEDPARRGPRRRQRRPQRLANLEVRQANAFDLPARLEGEGARFDVVVLDPPAFRQATQPRRARHRRRRSRVQGDHPARPPPRRSGWARRRRARAPARSRARTSTSSSSPPPQTPTVPVHILARQGAAADHPELAGVPETAHLKCWVLRAL
jgi:23S rRNA (cytosine1962-C5)-methyltransferase